MQSNQSYIINSEYNITEILSHFDSEYIISVIEDKLKNLSFSSSIVESNVVVSFEDNFKLMKQTFTDDGANINIVRSRIYKDIIIMLCDRFNIRFNELDDTIDLYTAAFYAYDFLVCNRNNIMINFYTSFIVNNKDYLYGALNLDEYKKAKDMSTSYNKKMYTDNKYIIISANMEKVIKFISTLDIKLLDIFKSTYINPDVVMFLDNAFADKGNFFADYYCKIGEEELPIVITNIRLKLQQIIGNINQNSIDNFINKGDR